MKLTREQRAALFAGNCPNLSGTGQCPCKRGDIIRLSSLLHIHVVRVDPARDGWRLIYEVTDKRDPARLLRRTPPVAHYGKSAFDEHGFPLPQEGHETAAESSYTAGGGATVADAGEAVSASAQAKLTQEAYMLDGQERTARRLRHEATPLVDRLKHQIAEAEALGLDPRRDIARLEAGVAKLERTIKQAKQQRAA